MTYLLAYVIGIFITKIWLGRSRIIKGNPWAWSFCWPCLVLLLAFTGLMVFYVELRNEQRASFTIGGGSRNRRAG